MPPNRKARKVRADAAGRALLRLKGDPTDNGKTNRRKAVAAASTFHGGAHLTQAAAEKGDFLSGDKRCDTTKSKLDSTTLDEFLEFAMNSGKDVLARAEVVSTTTDTVRLLVRQSMAQRRVDGVSSVVVRQDLPRENDEMAADQSGLLTAALKYEVPIPRRPIKLCESAERFKGSVEELNRLEETAFVNWRLRLSHIEEEVKLTVTPFERNLEYWRQLWRVLERSDIIFQILDARNPLFFRCPDLERYIREIDPLKRSILLLNKADLVPEDHRKAWTEYFTANHIPCLYYSSLKSSTAAPPPPLSATVPFSSTPIGPSEQVVPLADTVVPHSEDSGPFPLNNPAANDPNKSTICLSTDEDDGRDSFDRLLDEFMRNTDYREQPHEAFEAYLGRISASGRVLDSSELLFTLLSLKKIWMKEKLRSPISGATLHNSWCITFGFVGYPNVGKSTLINSLLGCKAVSVGRQPGKTKHFQTIPLPILGLTLCDCPGLVFPQIVSSKSHLVLNGVASIDNLRSYISPIQLLCNYIPDKLARHYNLDPTTLSKARLDLINRSTIVSKGILKPKEGRRDFVVNESAAPLDAMKFLTALAVSRGHFAGGKGAHPDLFAEAKLVLRDYTTGKLVHCVKPPPLLAAPATGLEATQK